MREIVSWFLKPYKSEHSDFAWSKFSKFTNWVVIWSLERALLADKGLERSLTGTTARHGDSLIFYIQSPLLRLAWRSALLLYVFPCSCFGILTAVKVVTPEASSRNSRTPSVPYLF